MGWGWQVCTHAQNEQWRGCKERNVIIDRGQRCSGDGDIENDRSGDMFGAPIGSAKKWMEEAKKGDG